jgi:hypothetical protein
MTTALLPRGRRGILLSLMSVALLLMASCGRGVASTVETSTPHDVIVVGKPAARIDDGERQPLAGATLVASREDLLDERRVVPDDVLVDPDDPTQLIVRFTAGATPCTGVRLSVDAGPAMVDVALYIGTPPEHADALCDTAARALEVRSVLDRPLGSRELIWRFD